MAIVTIDDTNLTNIAEAIREKNGTEDTYKPSEMAAAIAAITTGGGESGGIEITGDASYLFSCEYLTGTATQATNQYKALFNMILNNATTKDLTNTEEMFYVNKYLTEIPIDINLTDGASCSSIFYGADTLTKCPKITGKPGNTYYMFYGCKSLRDVSALENIEFNAPDGTDRRGSMFYNCYALREIPASFLKQMGRGTNSTNSYKPYYNPFNMCYGLKKIEDLGVSSAEYTSNAFSGFSYYLFQLRKFTFETNEDGTPKTANWTKQTIDLSAYVGYTLTSTNTNTKSFLQYNPECVGKNVGTVADYEKYKDDPDWYTGMYEYATFNKDSALELIKTLPDTSAYNGINTIKFKGGSGQYTGGAIRDLTAEEIAIATAKGWTVTLAS